MVFVAVAMSAVSFHRGNVLVGGLFALVAAAVVTWVVVLGVQARRVWLQELGGPVASPYTADAGVRRVVARAAGAAGAFGVCLAGSFAVLAARLVPQTAGSVFGWMLTVIVCGLPGLAGVALAVAAGRLARYKLYGAASALHTMPVVYSVGFITLFSILGGQWLITAGDVVVMVVAGFVHRELLRAEEALTGGVSR
ncbi:hypothetical protein AB0C76_36450 [Kitasatospora sp. NPDC048722]|uniref:hypothetical protein n=1 Tax=Kitasatospora sp. NPDC048722 TaxID=3155639 RepID=UPI0033DBFCC4